jgi:hypothetical protein
VQTIPNKLPELVINSELSKSPSNVGATLPTLLRAAVHPGTIAMTDFRQGLRLRLRLRLRPHQGA